MTTTLTRDSNLRYFHCTNSVKKNNQEHQKKPKIDAMIMPLVLLYLCGRIGVVLIKNKTKLPKLNQIHRKKATIDAPITPLIQPYPCGCFCLVLIKYKTKLTKLNQ